MSGSADVKPFNVSLNATTLAYIAIDNVCIINFAARCTTEDISISCLIKSLIRRRSLAEESTAKG